MKRESSSMDVPSLEDGQSIVKVLSLKGSNLIEVTTMSLSICQLNYCQKMKT